MRRRTCRDEPSIDDPMSVSLPLSAQVFAILSGLIEEHTGLHYDLEERELLADRVSPRAVEHGFESLLDYYYFLRYDPGADAEFKVLVDALVVNETYFFRELPALKVIVDAFVPKIIAEFGGHGLVRPCATVKEPDTGNVWTSGAARRATLLPATSRASARACSGRDVLAAFTARASKGVIGDG